MKQPKDILLEAMALIGERGQDYGGVENNFARIATLFALASGIALKPYQAALFLACVKMARLHTSPMKQDNYLDGINYLAFAALLARRQQQDELDDETI